VARPDARSSDAPEGAAEIAAESDENPYRRKSDHQPRSSRRNADGNVGAGGGEKIDQRQDRGRSQRRRRGQDLAERKPDKSGECGNGR
jgi:hypothetical protein